MPTCEMPRWPYRWRLCWCKCPVSVVRPSKRSEQERQREEERVRREIILRQDHVAERRSKVLDEILEELAALDRLRRLVAGLENEVMTAENGHRVAEFLALAQRRLASRETAISAGGLEQRSRNRSCSMTMTMTPFGRLMASTNWMFDEQKDAVPP